jgi:hypothetical protein
MPRLRPARGAAVALLALSLLAGSSALAPGPVRGQPTPAVTPPPRLLGEFGQVETEVRQVRRPSCWKLIVRGKLHNPYDQPVDDVRLIVRLRATGEHPREIERLETDVEKTIAPDAWASFSRTLTTRCTSTFNDISVVAFATHRGAATLATPALGVEAAASRTEQAPSGATDVPIVTSPVVAFP